jgi:hypothetical protein
MPRYDATPCARLRLRLAHQLLRQLVQACKRHKHDAL